MAQFYVGLLVLHMVFSQNKDAISVSTGQVHLGRIWATGSKSGARSSDHAHTCRRRGSFAVCAHTMPLLARRKPSRPCSVTVQPRAPAAQGVLHLPSPCSDRRLNALSVFCRTKSPALLVPVPTFSLTSLLPLALTCRDLLVPSLRTPSSQQATMMGIP